jgi:hypothetical protein
MVNRNARFIIVYCRQRATPVRNFNDAGIEGFDGQAEAESEVKTQ